MFVVIGPECWGRDAVLELAARQARANAPKECKRKMQATIYETSDPNAHVDDDGVFHWADGHTISKRRCLIYFKPCNKISLSPIP